MERVSLPIKTKIAAWWMIIFGGLLWPIVVIGGLLAFAVGVEFGGLIFLGFLSPKFVFIFSSILFLPIVLSLLSSFFLLKKKRWAWWFAMGVIGIGLISWFMAIARGYHSFSPIIPLVFFILLLLAFFLFKGRWKLGAAIGMILLFFHQFVSTIGFHFFFNSIISLLFSIPFIFLLVDRKNFWKIAS